MKNIIILSILILFYSCGDEEPLDLEALFFSCNESGQEFNFEEYDGLVEECTIVLSNVDFSSSVDGWESDENEYNRTIEGGKLRQESFNNTSWYFFNDVRLSENVNDYQISVELDILSGSNDFYHVMTWGGEDRLDNFYSMGINGNNELRIGRVRNNQDLEVLFYDPSFAAIIAGTNLLTIRVVDDKHYFFINRKFITLEELNLFGSEIGFNVPAMCTNTLDNVQITQFRIE